MRVKLMNLHLFEGEPEELNESVSTLANPLGMRRRRRVVELQPGQVRVRASLVVIEENGYADDCGCDFEFWLDELPKGSQLGSVFDLDVKPIKAG